MSGAAGGGEETLSTMCMEMIESVSSTTILALAAIEAGSDVDTDAAAAAAAAAPRTGDVFRDDA